MTTQTKTNIAFCAIIIILGTIFFFYWKKQQEKKALTTIQVKQVEKKRTDSVRVSVFDSTEFVRKNAYNEILVRLNRFKKANVILADSVINQRRRYEANKTVRGCDSLLNKLYALNNGLQDENDSLYLLKDNDSLRIVNLNGEVLYLKGSVKQSDELTTKALSINKNPWIIYGIASGSNICAGAGIGIAKGKIGGQIKALTNFSNTGLELGLTYKIY